MLTHIKCQTELFVTHGFVDEDANSKNELDCLLTVASDINI